MAERDVPEEGTTRAVRKPSEPLPWARFWWKEWLADPGLRRLTLDQRGRFMDVFASTYGTDTPGVMDEDAVRAWAGYSPEDWKKVREAFARVFNLKRRKGKWVLVAILQDYEASLEIWKRARERSMKGVAARRGGKDLATPGSTPGQPQVPPGAAPQVELGLNKILDSDSEKRLKTGKSESDSSARAQTSRSRAGSAGSAGPSRQSVLDPIAARALDGKPPANGGSA
jgi:uncharacterized protein YdaU (DUF1376 family)